MNNFDSDYYEKLLLSLTINSRTIITELTTIAEQNINHAQLIVDMIETRIKKSPPHHKLYVMYLMDSICKNIGSPYNLIFAKNLFKVFTETYSFIPDTSTRQHLINLFKTWINTKTSTGLALFPGDLISKIETFIINATKIPSNFGNQNLNLLNVSKLTPDMLLRESKILLNYIITLNLNIERLKLNKEWISSEEAEFIKNLKNQRNNLISILNDLSDQIVCDLRPIDPNGGKTLINFEKNVKHYHVTLVNIRRDLDDQRFQQESFIKTITPKINEIKQKEAIKQEKLLEKQLQAQFLEKNKISLNYKPNLTYFNQWNKSIDQIPALLSIVQNWGKTPVKSDIDEEPLSWSHLSHNEPSKADDSKQTNGLGFTLPDWETPKEMQNEQLTNSLGFTLPSWDLPNADANLGITIALFDLNKLQVETESTPEVQANESTNKPTEKSDTANDPTNNTTANNTATSDSPIDTTANESAMDTPILSTPDTPSSKDADDDYTPYEPPTPQKKSSLKRSNNINYGVVKRVRFNV